MCNIWRIQRTIVNTKFFFPFVPNLSGRALTLTTYVTYCANQEAPKPVWGSKFQILFRWDTSLFGFLWRRGRIWNRRFVHSGLLWWDHLTRLEQLDVKILESVTGIIQGDPLAVVCCVQPDWLHLKTSPRTSSVRWPSVSVLQRGQS